MCIISVFRVSVTIGSSGRKMSIKFIIIIIIIIIIMMPRMRIKLPVLFVLQLELLYSAVNRP